MSFFSGKSPYEINHSALDRKQPRKPVSPQAKKLALQLVLHTLLAIVVYFGCAALQFYSIFSVYFILAVVFLFAYVIYNKGFVLRDATPEMLDPALTLEEKQAKIAAAKARMERSRWMLTVIIPLIVAILADFLYVYVIVDALELLKSVL